MIGKKENKIKNVWVAISRNNQLNRVLFLSTGCNIKNIIHSTIKDADNDYKSKQNGILEWTREALVLEQRYYYNCAKIQQDDSLFSLKNKVLLENALSGSNSVISLRTNKNKGIDEKDSIRFLILEYKEKLVFLGINSRATVKKATILDVFNSNKDSCIGVESNIIDINTGIHISDYITAVYEKEEERLYVLDVLGFERMMHFKERNKEKASLNFEKFRNGNYTISGEKWKIKFDEVGDIKSEILKSTRAINRLSNFKNDSTYSILKIQDAVNQLSDEKTKVKFNEDKKRVEVNLDNYKTFIGIIHNGIVKRLISGDIEVVI